MRAVRPVLPIYIVHYTERQDEPSFSYRKYLWWYLSRVLTVLGFIILIIEGLRYYYYDQEGNITPPTTTTAHPDPTFELLSDLDNFNPEIPIPGPTTTNGYESLETQIPTYNIGERDRVHDCPDIDHEDEYESNQIPGSGNDDHIENPGQSEVGFLKGHPHLPLDIPNLLDNPKTQIKFEIKRIFGKLSARCTEYETEKSDTVECQGAEKTFQDFLKGLQEEMVVVKFECNFTVQIDNKSSHFGALWSKETCITSEENGNVYYEYNLMTYKGLFTTEGNQNYDKVRNETGLWCKCLETWDPLEKQFGYKKEDKEHCFKIVAASKATQAFVAGKGIRRSCKPAQVLLEYIPWKQDQPQPAPLWQHPEPDYN